MECQVIMTVAIDVEVADGADDDAIKDEAWFRLFDDNDASNWPDGTVFLISREGNQG